MFYALSKTLDVLLTPLGWALCWGLLAVLGKTPVTRWAAFASVFVLYVFSVDYVANDLLYRLESSAPRTIRADVHYDAVILLGGPVDHGATQTFHVTNYGDSVERLLTTFDLLRTDRASNVIVTGGTGAPGDDVVEARVLAAQLESWGISASRILLEDRSVNTREDALFSKHIVEQHGFKTVLVVTSAFHMPRALDCFRAVGLAVDTLPVDYRSHDRQFHQTFIPRADALVLSTLAVREFAGRWIYRIVGYGKG